MENKRFLTAQDVMEMLGFVTIKGRVSTQYFMKRIYGLSTDKEVG